MDFVIGAQTRRPRRSRRATAIRIFDEDGEELVDLTASPSAHRFADEDGMEEDSDFIPSNPSHQTASGSASRSSRSSGQRNSWSSTESGRNSSSRNSPQFVPADYLLEEEDENSLTPELDVQRVADSRRSPDRMDDEDEGAEEAKRLCMEPIASDGSQGHNSTVTDDSVMCPVCFEAWTSDGPHRVIALKCGHLFGLSCIEKWMLTTKKCPSCQQSIRKPDIRILFVRSLKVMDTSEKRSLEKRIEDQEKEIQRLKSQVAIRDMGLTQVNDRIHKLEQQNEHLKSELLKKEQQLHLATSRSAHQSLGPSARSVIAGTGAEDSPSTSRSNNSSGSSSRFSGIDRQSLSKPVTTPTFQLVRQETVSATGGCRIMATCRNLDMIAISVKNPNPLFHGFGIRRINPNDYSLSNCFLLHQMPITDMAFKKNEPLLLSSSMDKTVKLTNLMDSETIATLELQSQPRSCCWNPDQDNNCFVGLNNGGILGYDIRNPSHPTHEFDGFADNPLISIQFVDKSIGDSSQDEGFSGFLCNSLNKSFFFEIDPSSGDLKSKVVLPFEGKFLPCHYDQESGYGLISSRPWDHINQRCMKHRLITLTKEPDTRSVSVNLIREFDGGSKSEVMSKSKVFTDHSSYDSDPFVFAADEANNAMLLYDVRASGMGVRQVIKNPRPKSGDPKPVLDIGLVRSNSTTMQIATLCETGIAFFERKFLC